MELTDFQTFFGYFHVFHVVEHIPDSFKTITIKNETFQKNRAAITYLIFDIFWFYMLWGIQNQLQVPQHDVLSYPLRKYIIRIWLGKPLINEEV
jgi:hypothetical protein